MKIRSKEVQRSRGNAAPLFCAEKARISPKRCRRTDINLKKCTFSNTLPLFYKLKYSIEKEQYQSLYGKVILTICCFEKVHNSKLVDGRQILNEKKDIINIDVLVCSYCFYSYNCDCE